MKTTRLLFIVAALATTGCATSLGPTDNFNDWTNSASYHHYQQSPAAATYTVDVTDGASGE